MSPTLAIALASTRTESWSSAKLNTSAPSFGDSLILPPAESSPTPTGVILNSTPASLYFSLNFSIRDFSNWRSSPEHQTLSLITPPLASFLMASVMFFFISALSRSTADTSAVELPEVEPEVEPLIVVLLEDPPPPLQPARALAAIIAVSTRAAALFVLLTIVMIPLSVKIFFRAPHRAMLATNTDCLMLPTGRILVFVSHCINDTIEIGQFQWQTVKFIYIHNYYP